MTKLMIDGKALYIHRANFQIIDSDCLTEEQRVYSFLSKKQAENPHLNIEYRWGMNAVNASD